MKAKVLCKWIQNTVTQLLLVKSTAIQMMSKYCMSALCTHIPTKWCFQHIQRISLNCDLLIPKSKAFNYPIMHYCCKNGENMYTIFEDKSANNVSGLVHAWTATL